MPFQPKQITKFDAARLGELQGDVSEIIIRYCLDQVPPISSGDIIHDNAAGAGAVTTCIMERLAPGTDIHIDLTDINEQFVVGCKALAESKKWPVSTATMPAQSLAFPDNRFTHSFTTFAFHCIGDAVAASKEIHRTLKPGGTAVTTVWSFMPHLEALQQAHWLTRGRDGPMPPMLASEEPFGKSEIKQAFEQGGFSDFEFYERESSYAVPDTRGWAQLAWSYLGALPDGWTREDEDKWDEVLDEIVRRLESGRGISRNDKGETVLTFEACILVARK